MYLLLIDFPPRCSDAFKALCDDGQHLLLDVWKLAVALRQTLNPPLIHVLHFLFGTHTHTHTVHLNLYKYSVHSEHKDEIGHVSSLILCVFVCACVSHWRSAVSLSNRRSFAPCCISGALLHSRSCTPPPCACGHGHAAWPSEWQTTGGATEERRRGRGKDAKNEMRCRHKMQSGRCSGTDEGREEGETRGGERATDGERPGQYEGSDWKHLKKQRWKKQQQKSAQLLMVNVCVCLLSQHLVWWNRGRSRFSLLVVWLFQPPPTPWQSAS